MIGRCGCQLEDCQDQPSFWTKVSESVWRASKGSTCKFVLQRQQSRSADRRFARSLRYDEFEVTSEQCQVSAGSMHACIARLVLAGYLISRQLYAGLVMAEQALKPVRSPGPHANQWLEGASPRPLSPPTLLGAPQALFMRVAKLISFVAGAGCQSYFRVQSRCAADSVLMLLLDSA